MVHVQTTTNHVTMDLDSGAEVTVWPPELFPQVATQESPESRRGVKYLDPEIVNPLAFPILDDDGTI